MPMIEHYVSTSRIVAVGAWSAAAFLVLTAWLVLLVLHRPGPATLLCITGGIGSVAASVLSIRCYILGLGRLIRVTAGLDSPEPSPELRVVH